MLRCLCFSLCLTALAERSHPCYPTVVLRVTFYAHYTCILYSIYDLPPCVVELNLLPWMLNIWSCLISLMAEGTLSRSLLSRLSIFRFLSCEISMGISFILLLLSRIDSILGHSVSPSGMYSKQLKQQSM